jgi:LCP family protein required for cell wall assembly
VGGTVFVLVIGSDERPGLDGARGDALHLIGLNAGAGQATILNLPRDLWVEIPGHGQGRINEAYHLGGPQLQAAAVHALTGAPISYVLTTTFDGLVRMVDAFGGLEVQVPYDMADANSGAVFPGGRHRLSGQQVLGFARNRAIPRGDLTRTTHQGQLIVHALETLRRTGTSKADVLHYLDVLFRSVRLEGASVTDLYRLGRAALAVDSNAVRNYTVPGRIGAAGPLSVVHVVQPAATRLFEDFRDDAVLQAH